MLSVESRCVVGPGKYTLCKRVRASFSPEILLAGAVKRVKNKKLKQNSRQQRKRARLYCKRLLATRTRDPGQRWVSLVQRGALICASGGKKERRDERIKAKTDRGRERQPDQKNHA